MYRMIRILIYFLTLHVTESGTESKRNPTVTENDLPGSGAGNSYRRPSHEVDSRGPLAKWSNLHSKPWSVNQDQSTLQSNHPPIQSKLQSTQSSMQYNPQSNQSSNTIQS